MRNPEDEDSVARWRKRKRYERIAAVLLVMVCVGMLWGFDRAGWISPWFGREGVRVVQRQRDLRHLDGQKVRVRRITKQLDFELFNQSGQAFDARLLGIRPTPAYGPQAAGLAKYLTAVRSLKLHLDPAITRDTRNHLRMDLILASGQSLTERLLLAGVVRAQGESDHPASSPLHRHHRYERFQLLERQAKITGVGIWEGSD